MSGISDSNLTDTYDQSQIVIMGGTDNTKIGNVGDALKVEGEVTTTTDPEQFVELKAILEEILIELKLIKKHMETITDDDLRIQDIDSEE